MAKKQRVPTLLEEVNVKRQAAGKQALTERDAFKLINERHMDGDIDFDIAEYLTRTN
jgi:hypothetical protein